MALYSSYNGTLMKTKSSLHVFIWFAVSILVWADDASAYLPDPGTSSMLLQALFSAIFGGIFLIKVYWGKLKIFFSRDKKTNLED